MRPLRSAPLWLFALAVLAGCASTKVTSQQPYEGPKIARPDRIIVYDFAATPADVPAGSAVASEYSAPSTPMTAEQIATGRKRAPKSRRSWSRRSRTWDFQQCWLRASRRPRSATW